MLLSKFGFLVFPDLRLIIPNSSLQVGRMLHCMKDDMLLNNTADQMGTGAGCINANILTAMGFGFQWNQRFLMVSRCCGINRFGQGAIAAGVGGRGGSPVEDLLQSGQG